MDDLNIEDMNIEEILPEKPYENGVLENGLSYYVRTNSKPKMRAALALAVKVGSVLEEEEERGVAHIIEHLAFRATTKYTNHDLVKILESTGAEFGACQNAVTTADKTVYKLVVPVDKPELLSQAISILAEFSSEIRLSAEDLEKERGIVLIEFRGNRNASGRTRNAHWLLMLEGSKYAERSPIGLEKVIRRVSPEIIKRFYKKWYHLKNMAVIAIGDFSDTESVVELIKTHFNSKLSTSDAPVIPSFEVPSHEQPRISCSVESEAAGSKVMISCKLPVSELRTVKDYRELLAESMFFQALNRRFIKISKKENPPIYSCSATSEVPVLPVKAYVMSSTCKKKGTVVALESMLTEVARVRLHGFSAQEISLIRASMMSKMESAVYLESDLVQSTGLRDACLQHFLCNKPVVEIKYEEQLQETILPNISTSEVSKYAENFRTSSSCVINAIEPRAVATVEDLKSVMLKINSMEEDRSITPWDDENIPEGIVTLKPTPGNIVEQFEHSNIEATELVLSNGMRVCYKCRDFSNQVLFTGFSFGGLSELRESEYISCLMGEILAREIGIFGYKPSVLMDMLAGKKAEKVDIDTEAYMRTFSGACSPSDLETALQLVYQLFTTNVGPGEEYLRHFNEELAKERIHARERDPLRAFTNRNSYFFRPIKKCDLTKVDPYKACESFNKCFKDPSTFTVIVVGNIDPAIACPLILQYLGGIPRPSQPIMNFNREELKGLPYTFPTSIKREVVRVSMVEPQCIVQLCFPVEIKDEVMTEDINFVGILCKLLHAKMIQVLRFDHGQIYSVSISSKLDGDIHSRIGDICGAINVKFFCDPELSSSVVDLALDEIVRLQEEGPSDTDISNVLEILQREHEDAIQNEFWLDEILHSYLSRIYSGDVGKTFKVREEARSKVLEMLTPSTAQLALQRILPFPCKNKYTAVVLMPQASRLKDVKILACLAGVAVLVLTLCRCRSSH